MSISERIANINAAKSDIAAAIVKKGVTVPDDAKLADYAALIAQITASSGSGSSSGGSTAAASDGDIRFLDYDGTVLYSYSVEEANALTALPELPEHDGLTAQSWNYSLESVQAATHALDVGATFIADDGKTRFYLQFDQDLRLDFQLYYSQSVSGGVTIDWGDGSEAETLSGTGVVNTTHTYPGKGSYVLTLEVTDGTLTLASCKGDADDTDCNACGIYISSEDEVALWAFAYSVAIRRVEIGANVDRIDNYYFCKCPALRTITLPDGITRIGSNAFWQCYTLTHITIPDSVTSIGSYAYNRCSALTNVSIPDSVTSIGGYAFYNCYALTHITIPDGVASIGGSAFYSCYALTHITIPDSVTSISSSALRDCYALADITIPADVVSISTYAFYDCFAMAAYYIMADTPPTLSSSNVFTGIPDDCVIYVPAGSLADYQEATNWATYADYMQEMEA
ncbi:MAG: leucine-rich repeat protein [Clostridiales bacterium]|nr:leucine-rich repeat protein [Clostridiales bacterium]